MTEVAGRAPDGGSCALIASITFGESPAPDHVIETDAPDRRFAEVEARFEAQFTA